MNKIKIHEKQYHELHCVKLAAARGKSLEELGVKPGDTVLLDEKFGGPSSVAPTNITAVNVVDSNLGLKTVRSATFNDFFKFPKTSGEKK